MSSNYVPIDVDYLHQTDSAVLVEEPDVGEKWIPKSLLSAESLITAAEASRGDPITISVKEWFLEKEGLI